MAKPKTAAKPPRKDGIPTDAVAQLQMRLENAEAKAAGATRLGQVVDILRAALEEIVAAEMDYGVKPPQPVQAPVLRAFAVSALDQMSNLTGQSWRRIKIVGSRAGDRSLPGNYTGGEG